MKATLYHNGTYFESYTPPIKWSRQDVSKFNPNLITEGWTECVSYAQTTLQELTPTEKRDWDLYIDGLKVPRNEWV